MHLAIANEKRSETRPKSISQYIENIHPILEENGIVTKLIEFEEKILEDEFDLIWAPGLGNRRVPPIVMAMPHKSICTIHGINSLFDPLTVKGFGLRKGLGHFLWRKKIQRDWSNIENNIMHVISVSDLSKTEISKKMNININNITRIYNGIESDFFDLNKNNCGDYIIHVSQYSYVKNIPRLIAAYEIFRKQHDMPLRIVSINAPEMAVPEGCTIIRDALTRSEIAELLSRAHVMFMPSIEETFCLPVLEAMAARVPVVTSLGTGAAEVAGDGAVLVDPLDVSAMAEGLTAAVVDKALRAVLVERARARAGSLTWRRSAEEHLALFRRLGSRL
ncbi:MAG: hypothetical protein CO163_06790 [Rhodobacterales bacterium CG_4_9_14_3_um_filter_71_31]|nr:MAG: hypothetical protein CO163_06790 [Rhodobacterales bacterium CG_4_9_14_3_um_filter_71_31]